MSKLNKRLWHQRITEKNAQTKACTTLVSKSLKSPDQRQKHCSILIYCGIFFSIYIKWIKRGLKCRSLYSIAYLQKQPREDLYIFVKCITFPQIFIIVQILATQGDCSSQRPLIWLGLALPDGGGVTWYACSSNTPLCPNNKVSIGNTISTESFEIKEWRSRLGCFNIFALCSLSPCHLISENQRVELN